MNSVIRPNNQISKIYNYLDRAVASFKLQQVCIAAYRYLLAVFSEAITTMIALHFYAIAIG